MKPIAVAFERSIIEWGDKGFLVGNRVLLLKLK